MAAIPNSMADTALVNNNFKTFDVIYPASGNN